MTLEEALLHPDFEHVQQWFHSYTYANFGDYHLFIFQRAPFWEVWVLLWKRESATVHLIEKEQVRDITLITDSPWEAVKILLEHPKNIHIDELEAIGQLYGSEV